jgi:hypothetical protein
VVNLTKPFTSVSIPCSTSLLYVPSIPEGINFVCSDTFFGFPRGYPRCSLKWLHPGNPYWRGGLSTVDLLVLTSLDQLKRLFTLYKTRFFNEELNHTEPSPSASVPGSTSLLYVPSIPEGRNFDWRDTSFGFPGYPRHSLLWLHPLNPYWREGSAQLTSLYLLV